MAKGDWKMIRKGLKEVRRSTKGNTYIAAGIVTDQKAIGCPECDTVYLQLHRDGDGTQTLCVTPEEAIIICNALEAAVYGGGR
jgi:hypothetical protein